MSPQPESLLSQIIRAVRELISLYSQQAPYRVDIPDKLHDIYGDLVYLAKRAGLPRPPTAKDTGPEDWQHEIEMWLLEALAQWNACSTPEPESSEHRNAGVESETVQSNPSKSNTTKLDKVTLAIALKQKHPDWTAEKIASEVGCTAANLSKNSRWQTVVGSIRAIGQQCARREGKDRRSKDRGGKDRGRDMDQYAESTEDPISADVRCVSCDDPAGKDDDGYVLTIEGKPRCRECWNELRGG